MTSVGPCVLFVMIVGLLLADDASALTVTKAKIVGDRVVVVGYDAAPNAILMWEAGVNEEVVGQANSNGRFRFSSNLMPPSPDCTGLLSDSTEFIKVEVDNCRGPIDGFYTADQDIVFVDPGQVGSARSFCDFGDFAVSGQLVIYALNPPPEIVDVRMRVFGKVIDGTSGQQSWTASYFNAGENAAEIRLAAECARTLPPKASR